MGNAELEHALRGIVDDIPGLRDHGRRAAFARHLQRSARGIGWMRALRSSDNLAIADVDSTAWNALHAVVRLARDGDIEEATWLAFLAIHFGPDDRRPTERWRSTRLVYGSFGGEPLTWCRVSAEPGVLSATVAGNEDVAGTLRFGNHRKYESPRQIAWVLSSYVAGIASRSGIRQALLFEGSDPTAQARFDRLFKELTFIPRFGRTARFDFLTTLGNLGVYEMEPPSLYLDGATGPKRGAEAVLGRPVRSRREWAEADIRLSGVARDLDVPVQAFEDALCKLAKGVAINPDAQNRLRDELYQIAMKQSGPNRKTQRHESRG